MGGEAITAGVAGRQGRAGTEVDLEEVVVADLVADSAVAFPGAAEDSVAEGAAGHGKRNDGFANPLWDLEYISAIFALL